jgi:CRISPR-associated endonuclease Cas1
MPNIQDTAKMSLRALRCAEPALSDPELEQDDLDWANRCELWASRVQKAGGRRAVRERPRQPLVLSGHGVRLRIENGALTIRNGFTHYPQKQETYRFFKGELAIPERIIMLDGSGSISFDVLSWLAEQDVSLIRIDWRGEVICVASRSGYAANPYRVQWQRDTRADEIKRMEFSISKITAKIENSITTLEKSIRRNQAWNRAVEMAYSTLTKLDSKQPQSIIELRALEANAAAAYFRAWKGTPIKWRGISRRPIPDAWREIGPRTSLFQLAGNRNASHPVNAILNYAYTILQSQLQIQAIAEGYDPTIGIMHEGSNGSAAFVFDLMEPSRPLVDRKVLEFIKGHVFDPADFVIRSEGVCRLNPEMAAWVATFVARRNLANHTLSS